MNKQIDEMITRKDLVATTIRLPQDRMDIINEFKNKYHASLSEVIRVIVDNRLTKYFGTLRYIDYDQGESIRKSIIEMQNNLCGIERELNRIGVNYNQEIKMKNIERKYKDLKGFDMNRMMAQQKEIDEIKKQCSDFSQKEFAELVGQFTIAVEKFGKDLSCIRE